MVILEIVEEESEPWRGILFSKPGIGWFKISYDQIAESDDPDELVAKISRHFHSAIEQLSDKAAIHPRIKEELEKSRHRTETEVDFGADDTPFNHGYKTAAGIYGTGWMKFPDSAIQEILDRDVTEFLTENDSDEGTALNWAYGWTEGEQFNYETRPIFDNTIKKEGIQKFDKVGRYTESYIYRQDELIGEWVDGYANYILERIKTKKSR